MSWNARRRLALAMLGVKEDKEPEITPAPVETTEHKKAGRPRKE